MAYYDNLPSYSSEKRNELLTAALIKLVEQMDVCEEIIDKHLHEDGEYFIPYDEMCKMFILTRRAINDEFAVIEDMVQRYSAYTFQAQQELTPPTKQYTPNTAIINKLFE